jgi:hypothetical protein
MKVKRPSISMTQQLFRHMAYAAERVHSPRCAWVAQAIIEKLTRDKVPAPPDAWEPRKGKGRPTAKQRREQQQAEEAANFTF